MEGFDSWIEMEILFRVFGVLEKGLEDRERKLIFLL